jgi:hypothetical protein
MTKNDIESWVEFLNGQETQNGLPVVKNGAVIPIVQMTFD